MIWRCQSKVFFCLNYIRERSFRISEIPQPEEKRSKSNTNSDDQARQVKLHIGSYRPAESINQTDHRIQGIDDSPFCRCNGARKPDWRDVHTELQTIRNTDSDITMLHIEGAEEKTYAECQEHG